MIINFSEIKKSYLSDIQKQAKKETKNKEADSCEFIDAPYYKPIIKVPLLEGRKALIEFLEEYGEVKSAKYLQIIEDNTPASWSKHAVEYTKEQYSSEYDKFCTFMIHASKMDKKTCCKVIESYIKTHGNYIESPHCALLIENILNKNNVKAQNVCLKDYEDLEQHYFTVINMDDKANIRKPETWGKNAVICDAWAQICMKVPEAIEYYENMFNLENGSFYFDYAY